LPVLSWDVLLKAGPLILKAVELDAELDCSVPRIAILITVILEAIATAACPDLPIAILIIAACLDLPTAVTQIPLVIAACLDLPTVILTEDAC